MGRGDVPWGMLGGLSSVMDPLSALTLEEQGGHTAGCTNPSTGSLWYLSILSLQVSHRTAKEVKDFVKYQEVLSALLMTVHSYDSTRGAQMRQQGGKEEDAACSWSRCPWTSGLHIHVP